MDFSWSPDQLALRDTVVEFARRSLDDDVRERDSGGCFSRELWKLCADFGIQGLPFPEEYDGGGYDTLTTVMAMEALGSVWKDGGLIFSLNAQMWSVQMPIFRYGSEEQRNTYLRRLNTGEWIGAHGMSEPGSGSDAFSLRTRAEKQGDEYVLNGAKTFVTNAPVADVFLVFATVNRSRGLLGISAFLLERDTPGLHVGQPIQKMGLKTSPMAEVVFQDCRIPSTNLLGKQGRGAEIFNDSMGWERTCILAGAVGGMQRQLQACVRYAREREQFGKAIGDFQSVANRLVAMKLRREVSRLLLYRSTWARQAGVSDGAEAEIAKLYISEALVKSSLDAVQIHGGYGYTAEYEHERDLRDAIGSRLYSGTSEIQQALIARALGVMSR